MSIRSCYKRSAYTLSYQRYNLADSHSSFVQYSSQQEADCLFVFHAEGSEFPIYAPYVRMTAQKTHTTTRTAW